MGIFDFLKRKKSKEEKTEKVKPSLKKTTEGKEEKIEEGKPIQIAGKTKYNWQKDILWEPVLTEKGQNIAKNENTVVFKVSPKANKSEIKSAVEKIFNVKVEDVRTGNFKKRLRGRLKIRSKRSAFKKAYIRLAEGSRIAIFE